MSVVDELLREDDELQKLLRLKRAIDRKLSKLGVGKKRRRGAKRKDGDDVPDAEDFFDVADTANVHDED